MKSLDRGKNTLEIEVTNISSFGIWVFVDEKEFFLSYKDFPWFLDQPVTGPDHGIPIEHGVIFIGIIHVVVQAPAFLAA